MGTRGQSDRQVLEQDTAYHIRRVQLFLDKQVRPLLVFKRYQQCTFQSNKPGNQPNLQADETQTPGAVVTLYSFYQLLYSNGY